MMRRADRIQADEGIPSLSRTRRSMTSADCSLGAHFSLLRRVPRSAGFPRPSRGRCRISADRRRGRGSPGSETSRCGNRSPGFRQDGFTANVARQQTPRMRAFRSAASRTLSRPGRDRCRGREPAFRHAGWQRRPGIIELPCRARTAALFRADLSVQPRTVRPLPQRAFPTASLHSADGSRPRATDRSTRGRAAPRGRRIDRECRRCRCRKAD